MYHPAAVIDTSSHVESQICSAQSHRERAGVTADLDPPRIWTPGPNPLADLDSPGPYPLADLDPPPTKHSFFPIYSNCKLLGDVL